MHTFDEVCAAVYRQDYESLGALLDASKSINLRDEDGRTLLMHAVLAEEASPRMVKFLIERGADLDAADSAQQWTSLHFAARDQKRAIVQVLLESGAHPEPVDTFGNTPLWRAVMSRSPDPELIRLLMSFGANPGRKNNSGVAPIDTAVNLGHQELLPLLTKH